MPTGASPESPSGDSPEDFAFPASMSQEAFYYVERLCRGGASPFNVAVRFHLAGPLDAGRLEDALNAVIERHESLRTQFEEADGLLNQVVRPAAKIALEVTDLDHEPVEERAAEATRLGRLEAQRSFDLGRAPLLRAGLVRLSETEHILYVTVHHTVCDGWSVGILIEEMAAFYEAGGETAPLAPLPIQYADFAIWQREFLAGPEVGRQLEYWKKQLADAVEPEFPPDRPRPPVKLWNGDIVSEVLPAELTGRLHGIAQENGATLFHVFAAAFAILLHRYTGSTDILFGTPVAGRSRAELEPLIGTFINSLVLRTDLSGDPDFREALRRFRRTALGALENQDIPFESLVRELRSPRDPSRNPLFQINFTHQRAFMKPVKFGKVQLTPIPALPPGAIFDLNVFMVERDEGWRMSCDYCTDLFERGTAVRLLGHFRTLLQAIAEAPDRPISRYAFLSEQDVRQVEEWSGRETAYPREATIGSLFEDVVRGQGGKIALVQGKRELSYEQLHSWAGRLAGILQERGVGPGVFVPVAAGPGLERIAALVGVALAGGAYVPVDASYPAERIEYMLEDTRARVVVADAEAAAKLPDGSYELVRLEEIRAEESPDQIKAAGRSAMDPAYVLYTSGSTGEPKGVVVPQRAVVRLVRGNDFIEIGTEEVFLQASPLSFDASTLEIWGALLNGGRLIIPDSDKPALSSLAGLIKERQVSVLWLTAGLFQAMVEEHLAELSGVRNLLAGGDVLPMDAVRRALENLPPTRLINGYGPTENTTFTTCHTISKEDLAKPIPIGRPIANTSVWILDQAGQPAPPGAVGEICAAGDGLALGYLNNQELTRQKFVSRVLPGSPEPQRLYRTGDLGRWDWNGNLEFLGRTDRQVKIRGFRVEPAEVERVLGAHPAVAQCKVGTRGASAEKKILVAWVCAAKGARIVPEQLRAYLRDKLPAYACPDAFVELNDLPLNAHGKVDERALPGPGQREFSEEPFNPTEQRLAALWCELLNLPAVSPHDNFFDLGGHSLLGLRLFSRIRSVFGVSLSLSALLQAPTIRTLAQAIANESAKENDASSRSVVVPIQPGGNREPFWCVHGGDGRAMIYRKLAPYLDRDRPLLGIESPILLRNDPVKAGTVEEIAAEYLPILREKQPVGPYCLGGYSFGGMVAYEMARLLEAQGEMVAGLVIFDTMNPQLVRRLSLGRQMESLWRMHSHSGFISRIRGLRERLINFWKAQSGQSLAVRLRNLGRRIGGFLSERVRNEAGIFAPRTGEADSGVRGAQLIRAFRWSARDYEPLPYRGRVILLKTPEQHHGPEIPRDCGWADVAANLEIVDVPGEHMTLFDPGNVEVLAEALRERLRLFDG